MIKLPIGNPGQLMASTAGTATPEPTADGYLTSVTCNHNTHYTDRGRCCQQPFVVAAALTSGRVDARTPTCGR